MFKTIFVLRS